jgi:hypothetical protein
MSISGVGNVRVECATLIDMLKGLRTIASKIYHRRISQPMELRNICNRMCFLIDDTLRFFDGSGKDLVKKRNFDKYVDYGIFFQRPHNYVHDVKCGSLIKAISTIYFKTNGKLFPKNEDGTYMDYIIDEFNGLRNEWICSISFIFSQKEKMRSLEEGEIDEKLHFGRTKERKLRHQLIAKHGHKIKKRHRSRSPVTHRRSRSRSRGRRSRSPVTHRRSRSRSRGRRSRSPVTRRTNPSKKIVTKPTSIKEKMETVTLEIEKGVMVTLSKKRAIELLSCGIRF